MPNELLAREYEPPSTLRVLQAGRGIAALAVVFSHSSLGISLADGELNSWFYTITRKGSLGVDFFFVLSGFIIYYVNHDRVNCPDFTYKYAQSRLIRIYVPYLPVILAYILAYSTIKTDAVGADNWSWFSSLTLIPDGARPALGPAWTLQHEILFYFFALLCFRVGSFLWPSVLVILFFSVIGPIQTGGRFPLGMIDLEFLFGVFAAWCFIHKKLDLPLVLLLAGSLFIVAAFLVDHEYYRVLFGLGLACWILPIVRWEAEGRVRIGAFLMLLGNASYAIYLTHYPLAKELPRRVDVLDPYLMFTSLVVLCVIVGIAYHKLFEVRAIRLVKKWTDRRPAGKPDTATT